MKKQVFLVFLIVLAFSPIFSAEKDRLAVMDVSDKEELFSQKTIEKITDYIFVKLQGTGIYWMIPKSDRDMALEQAFEETLQGTRKECVDEKCQLSLTAQLHANFLINTEIIQLVKGKCQINIKKFDVEKRAGTEAWESRFNCTENGIYEAIDSLYFGGRKKNVSTFQEGKIGETIEEWDIGQGEETIVKFESNPQDAIVMLDGKMLCQKTPCSKMIKSGKHEITFQKENYLPQTRVHDIQKGSKIFSELEPNFGFLSVSSNLNGVEILLDGKIIGKAPISGREISLGAHQVEIEHDCFHKTGEKIIIERGQTKSVFINLTPRESAIKVYASDEEGNDVEAGVFVDGKEVGTAPGTFKIPLCSQKMTVLNNSGQYETWLTHYLKEKEVYEIKANLKNKKLPIENERTEKNTYETKNREENQKPITKTIRPLSWIGYSCFVLSGLSFITAIYYETEIKDFNKKARNEFNPDNPSGVQEYLDGAKEAELMRNILLGAGAGLIGVGALMFLFKKEVPVAFYADDKLVMFSYNLKF